MFDKFEDFTDSEIYEKYEGYPLKCFELIDNFIVAPNVGLEFYVNNSFYDGLDQNILKKLLDTYNLNIDDFYNFPTDSNEMTTLLNSLCEYRKVDDIKMILNLGANTNVQDKIHYTPFQSLMSGHSQDDIGKNPDKIKTVIDLLKQNNTKFVLEKWQFEEHYNPYMELDIFFVNFAESIFITDNINN